MKITFKTEFFPIILVLFAWVLGFYFAPRFPPVVVSHWNFSGTPDGFSSSTVGAFALPGLMTAMYLLFLGLPYLDPKKHRYADFQSTYHVIKSAFLVLILLIFAASGAYNLGLPISVSQVTSLSVGLVLIVLGRFMGSLKQNWFVGIKTPWTLSSETVWNKTHAMGGWLFSIFGLLVIIAPYLPPSAGMAAFICGALLATVGSFAYSYYLYTKEKPRKHK